MKRISIGLILLFSSINICSYQVNYDMSGDSPARPAKDASVQQAYDASPAVAAVPDTMIPASLPKRTMKKIILDAAKKDSNHVFSVIGYTGFDDVGFTTAESTFTPLMWASRHGDLSMVKKLSSMNADINMCNKPKKNTALIFATLNNHDDVVAYLVGKGAIKDWRNINGKSALDYAKTHVKGYREAIKAGKDSTGMIAKALKKAEKIVSILEKK